MSSRFQDPQFVEHICSLLRTGKYSDLSIRCGENEWPVHKAIVCTQSAYIDNIHQVRMPLPFEVSRPVIIFDEYRGRCTRLLDGYSHVGIDAWGGEIDPRELDCVIKFMYGEHDYFDTAERHSKLPLRLARLYLLAISLGVERLRLDLLARFRQAVKPPSRYGGLDQLWADIQDAGVVLRPLAVALRHAYWGQSNNDYQPSDEFSPHDASGTTFSRFPPPPEFAPHTTGINSTNPDEMRGRANPPNVRRASPTPSTPPRWPTFRKRAVTSAPPERDDGARPNHQAHHRETVADDLRQDYRRESRKIRNVGTDATGVAEPAQSSKSAGKAHEHHESGKRGFWMRCAFEGTDREFAFQLGGEHGSSVLFSIPGDLNFKVAFEPEPPAGTGQLDEHQGDEAVESSLQSLPKTDNPASQPNGKAAGAHDIAASASKSLDTQDLDDKVASGNDVDNSAVRKTESRCSDKTSDHIAVEPAPQTVAGKSKQEVAQSAEDHSDAKPMPVSEKKTKAACACCSHEGESEVKKAGKIDKESDQNEKRTDDQRGESSKVEQRIFAGEHMPSFFTLQSQKQQGL